MLLANSFQTVLDAIQKKKKKKKKSFQAVLNAIRQIILNS